ncbi:hypothetical protein [Leifsonia sp. SIMBA_070]
MNSSHGPTLLSSDRNRRRRSVIAWIVIGCLLLGAGGFVVIAVLAQH